MKSSYYIFLGCIAMVLLGCTEKSAQIFGTLEYTHHSNDRPMVYLIAPQSFDEIAASYLGEVIDSAVVNEQGKFAFYNVPTTDERLFIVTVQLKDKRPNYLQNEDPFMSNYMPIILEDEKAVEIEATIEQFQKSVIIKQPSKSNEELMRLRDLRLNAYEQFLKDKHWRVEDGSQLLQKEEAQLNYQEALMEFADQTKEFLAAMVAIRWASPTYDYEKIPELLFQQCQTWKEKTNHPFITQLCDKADASVLPVMIGDRFPNTKLPMVTGDTLSVAKQLGSTLTIVDLWASWCVPCRKENRDILLPLWEQYHAQGFQILAYGLESDEEAWKNAIQRDGADRWLHASHLMGDDAPFMKILRIQTIPANFLLDKDGNVVAKNLHGEALVAWIERYMAER